MQDVAREVRALDGAALRRADAAAGQIDRPGEFDELAAQARLDTLLGFAAAGVA